MKARAAGTNTGALTRSDEFSTIDSAIARRTSSSSRESSADASSGALRALRPSCLRICARRLLPPASFGPGSAKQGSHRGAPTLRALVANGEQP